MFSMRRLTLVGAVLTVFGALLMVRLFFLQVVSHKYYLTLAERQQVSSRIVYGRRGEIKLQNRNGIEAAVATTRSGYLVYVNPSKLEDATSTYNALSKIISASGLSIDRVNFFKYADKRDDPYEILMRRAEKPLAESIIAAGLPGIGAVSEEWRFYPFKSLAGSVLGFLGFDEAGSEVGRYGLESFYEDTLAQTPGFWRGSQSYGGIFLSFGRQLFSASDNGHDIILTIDLAVQSELERELDRLFEKWQPRMAAGVIIEPDTGRILAMSSRPSFDPNEFSAVADISYFINPLVSSIFELGSVFKPLTMAFALDQGAITPETEYYDAGFVEIGQARIENYDGKGRGKVKMQEVLNQSLNTGAVFVARQLGKEKFLEYIERFGFDEKTDIDLPAEAIGDVSNLLSKRDVEFASAAFGQGIAISPIAFVRAVSALANGGMLMQPYIAERVRKDGLPDEIHKPRPVRRVISEETSLEISRMLAIVVDKALLGGGAGPKNYSVAAKTGTAQIANKDGKGYSGEYLHSFFGYAPAFDSRFLVFLILEAPRGVEYASQSLGPSFLDLTNFLLHYYEVPPDR